jgi:hypothetical protein
MGVSLNISYSRYTSFVSNPERYRLYYELGLTPEGDDTPTLRNLGRRRGTVTHALYEAKYYGTLDEKRKELVAEYGEELVKRCERLVSAMPDLGPLFFVEHSFEIPILDGKHSIIGRIDHGFTADGIDRGGDIKTTKGTRTKKELSEYLGELSTSAQSHFYLKAFAEMGRPTEAFTYHVLLDAKDKYKDPTYHPEDVVVGPAQVARTMAQVYAACESIERMRDYGIEKPWPHSNKWPCCGDQMFCGYQGLCGRTLVRGIEPPGFTNRYAKQIQEESE